jgi:hypothetical protein
VSNLQPRPIVELSYNAGRFLYIHLFQKRGLQLTLGIRNKS